MHGHVRPSVREAAAFRASRGSHAAQPWQTKQPVVRLVNEFPDVDAPNKALVAQVEIASDVGHAAEAYGSCAQTSWCRSTGRCGGAQSSTPRPMSSLHAVVDEFRQRSRHVSLMVTVVDR